MRSTIFIDAKVAVYLSKWADADRTVRLTFDMQRRSSSIPSAHVSRALGSSENIAGNEHPAIPGSALLEGIGFAWSIADMELGDTDLPQLLPIAMFSEPFGPFFSEICP